MISFLWLRDILLKREKGYSRICFCFQVYLLIYDFADFKFFFVTAGQGFQITLEFKNKGGKIHEWICPKGWKMGQFKLINNLNGFNKKKVSVTVGHHTCVDKVLNLFFCFVYKFLAELEEKNSFKVFLKILSHCNNRPNCLCYQHLW